MTQEEFHILCQAEIRTLIADHLHLAPDKIAFKLAGQDLPAGLIATQAKYLQRARKKLPSWYAAGCIVPPLAYEQCSSEESASLRSGYRGKRALDLTGGLGVDSRALAQSFEEVIALEPDPVLANVVRWNAELLGIKNVQVVESSAEDYLESHKPERFDLIFIDPSRREEGGGRRFLLEECAPNVIDLWAQLREMGQLVLLKASPLMDLQEGLRLLHGISRVTVVAVGNECKEVLFEAGTDADPEQAESLKLRAVFFRKGGRFEYEKPFEKQEAVYLSESEIKGKQYLYEADVALYKAGLAWNWFRDQFGEDNGGMNHAQGYYFSDSPKADYPGNAIKILEVMEYKPSVLRKDLKKRGIRKANIAKRHFGISTKEIKQALKIEEGGRDWLLFTALENGARICVRGERVLR